MTVEEFRTAILEWDRAKSLKPHHWRIVQKLKPWRMKFYGERGPCDAIWPPTNPAESHPFNYRWNMKAPRNAGRLAVAIEECAKRGKESQVLGGLMNQNRGTLK